MPILAALLAAAAAAANTTAPAPPKPIPARAPASRPAPRAPAGDQTAMSVTMHKTSHAIMMPDPPTAMHPNVSAAGSATPR